MSLLEVILRVLVAFMEFIKIITELYWKHLRRNPIEDGAISGFSGQKSVPE